MGCIYSNYDGECTMWDKDFPIDNMGCTDDGVCTCQDDPDPSITCENYESGGS